MSNQTPSLLPTHGVDQGGIVRVGSTQLIAYTWDKSGRCSQNRERPHPIQHPAYCLHMGVDQGGVVTVGSGCIQSNTQVIAYTVWKSDLILRSVQRRPQMQFSMGRKVMLWLYADMT